MPGGRFAHHRPAMGAVGDEVLGYQITFGDDVLLVASPVRKGAAEDLCCLAHAFRAVG